MDRSSNTECILKSALKNLPNAALAVGIHGRDPEHRIGIVDRFLA